MSFPPIWLISLVVLVASFAGAASELKKINKKELYFQEKRDMSFSCVASNVGVNDSIQWSTRESLGSNEDIVSNVTGESVIVDTRNGSTLTSTISLKNSTKYKEARYFLYCKLLDDGGGELEKKTFQFRPIRRKNWPNVTVSPKEIKVGYGENFTLNCRTRGNLRAAGTELHVTWSKAGNVLKSDSQTALRNVVNLNYTVQKADGSSGGNYICKAFPKVAIQIEVSETVIVSVLPKLVGEPTKELYSEIGKPVKIPCNIDGYPLTIAWQRKTAGGVYQDIKGNTRFNIQDNGKTLTISSFQSDDAAEYVCKVKENQNIVQKTELIERVFAHIENGSKSQENVTLIPGETSEFKCDIVAVPSCVSWNAYSLHDGTKRDATSVSGVVKPSRCDNTLLLKNISAIENGQIFSCTNGDVTQKFLVVKMTKPRLTGKPTKEVKSEEGDDVTLKCDIEVTPLKIEWSDGDRPITGSKYVISTDPRVLHVKNVDYDDRGSFFCSAKNKLDKKGVKQRIILRVKDPLAPLWPVIGIVIVAVLVVMIIAVAAYLKKRKNAAKRRRIDGEELEECPGGAHIDGNREHGAALLNS